MYIDLAKKRIITKHIVNVFLFSFLINLTSSLFAQQNLYPLVHTPAVVAVNRTVPKNALQPGSIMPAYFSKVPTDEEIFRVHFFEEPLVPSPGIVKAGENKDVVIALAAFSQRKDADDFSAITDFIKKHAKSRWNGALLANLGIVYRRSGYYTQSMNAWQRSWDMLKHETGRKIKILADRVVAELMLINAWVGRKEKVDSLLKEISNRLIEGTAVERVSTIRRASWLMKNKPDISFMCGPYALNKIHTIVDSSKALSKKIADVKSTNKGFSLYELQNLANATGMNYQMAFRDRGATVILNSVVHWKLDHYSALIKFEAGHYECSDATMGTIYGREFWLSPAALDSSASGYFLVPAGALPTGWRTVTSEEGNRIFGKGQEPPDPGKHVSGGDGQSCGGCDCGTGGDGDGDGGAPSGSGKPMAQSNVHLAAVSLHIFDRPVYYSPPVGPPMFWRVDYHQRDAYQPANFSYSNMGPKWTFDYLSYIQDNPTDPFANADVYVMGGGVRTFNAFDGGTQSYAPEIQTNDILVRICPTCYELRHPDGSKEVYARPDGSTVNGRKIFLTKKVDIAGNEFTIIYDVNLRIVAMQDKIGQVTTISYENSSDIYKVTKVTDPFGRFASFNYDAIGRLIRITDMIGIVSSFTYDDDDFINKMTTPYGSTRFIKEDGPGNYRSLETQFPLGEREKVVFAEDAPGIAYSEPVLPDGMGLVNQNLNYRNTFFWDKKAMQEAPDDYTKARIYHWLHGTAGTGESGAIAPMLESLKAPLENRIWYRYAGQVGGFYANDGMSAKPSLVGRVLDDGTTQLTQHSYNSTGADTLLIDPAGRQFSKKYDNNNIDLLEIRQTKNNANELLAKFTYNSQHLPLTETDASGQVTHYTFNAKGQLLTRQNARNETTTYSYDANGYLLNINGPLPGAIIGFTYDGYGRQRTVTDAEGYTIRTDYDVLDRPTLINYPDSTFRQIVYDRLDAVHFKDRIGRWSHALYDSLDRLSAEIDALGRTTQRIWCSCGQLSEIIDPLKQITSFHYDIAGRLIAKTYHDGKTINYQYENTTSRLKETTDPKGQKTQFSYFIDNNLKQKDYVNALIATASVAYTYDLSYHRVRTMTDGTGLTTYSYNPAQSGNGSFELASIDGPLANDITTFSYDSLNRVISRSVNGVSSGTTYDALGRVTSQTNVLGSFDYNYVNQTRRLSSVDFSNGQHTIFEYYDNPGDQLLKQIWHKASDNSTISKFDYEYNHLDQVTKWTRQSGSSDSDFYEFTYDLNDQLISSTLKTQNASTILKRYAWQYDKAGNRTSEQVDNSVTAAIYNNLNQVTGQSDHGPLRFNGTTSEISSIMVKNQSANDSAITASDTTNHFETFVKTVPGTNNIIIKATDYSGNSNQATNNYNITVTPGVNSSLNYDDNGNTITSTNPGITYDWDAADRLVKITSSGGVTEFVYDGSGRRVAEKLNGSVIKRWLWDQTELIEERDVSGGTVTKRFFKQGEQVNGNNYYFTSDHLGSVRELVAADGITISARYDYDAYGRRTKISGTADADFGFTGHYYHASSGLNLALYRAYNTNTGRWLCRDPIGESGGQNLYGYATNNPVNYLDPTGWEPISLPEPPGPFGPIIIPPAPIIPPGPSSSCGDPNGAGCQAIAEGQKRIQEMIEERQNLFRHFESIRQWCFWGIMIHNNELKPPAKKRKPPKTKCCPLKGAGPTGPKLLS